MGEGKKGGGKTLKITSLTYCLLIDTIIFTVTKQLQSSITYTLTIHHQINTIISREDGTTPVKSHQLSAVLVTMVTGQSNCELRLVFELE